MCLYTNAKKVITELSITDEDNEIINKTSESIIIGTSYRQPNGKIEPFKIHLKHIIKNKYKQVKTKTSH